MKKTKRDIDDFLRFLTESVPTIEPSAFFASRVAHRADLERPVFFFQVSSFTRRALPLLVSLCFVTLLISYVLTPADLQNGSYTGLFIEQEEELEPVTAEEVLSLLIAPESEEVEP
jgi:hypothetical protein